MAQRPPTALSPAGSAAVARSPSVDAWTEYLCLEILPDRRVAITSRSAEPLMGKGWEAGEVVWPEGYDPENDDGDTLPISVGGKTVAGRDGDFLVGEAPPGSHS